MQIMHAPACELGKSPLLAMLRLPSVLLDARTELELPLNDTEVLPSGT